MAKPVLEYLSQEKYDRLMQIVAHAEELKKTAPKERKPREPMTAQQKIEAQAKRVKRAEEKLAALLAAQEAGAEGTASE